MRKEEFPTCGELLFFTGVPVKTADIDRIPESASLPKIQPSLWLRRRGPGPAPTGRFHAGEQRDLVVRKGCRGSVPVSDSLRGKSVGEVFWHYYDQELALARWEDPVYGLMPPALFIHVLEENLLIHKLDLHIVRLVCEDYRRKVNEGHRFVPVSFNLSHLDFDL